MLRLMIAHHEAAIPMSEAVLERTGEPEVKQLARSIIAAQMAEIENTLRLAQVTPTDNLRQLQRSEVALCPTAA